MFYALILFVKPKATFENCRTDHMIMHVEFLLSVHEPRNKQCFFLFLFLFFCNVNIVSYI